jgi:pimeloyl-ACP methyl ester carboxylesterase
MWAQNWKALSATFDVYAIDLPGFARSERQSVHFFGPSDALGFYYNCLDRWFDRVNFSKPVVLLGHSFGAYLAARYALRTAPAVKRVKRLVLADPWGVPRADPDFAKNLPFTFKVAMKIFEVTNPLSVLRFAGPLGPMLLPKIRPDFADRWEQHLDEPHAFYDYVFHCNAQYPPTGEAAFKACCSAGAFAKEPLESIIPEGLPADVDLFLLYGSKTWMDVARGCEMVEVVRSKGRRAAAALVHSAGHQLNTDNPTEFNAKALQACMGVLEQAL